VVVVVVVVVDLDGDGNGDVEVDAHNIVDALPRGHADRADQLTRAAESVVRNIAEGAGRWSQADSANRYKTARGEAMECAASLDVMKLRKVLTEARYGSSTSPLPSPSRFTTTTTTTITSNLGQFSSTADFRVQSV
jgi:four helix bundle protein